MVTELEIQSAYAALDDVRIHLEAATNTEAAARSELEARKAELLTGGTIDGKNAEVRDGQIKAALADSYSTLASLQAETARYRVQLTRAGIEVERIKTLLRLMEVTRP